MHLQAHPVGQFRLDFRQHGADALGHFDGVRTGLTLHRQHDGARTVVPGARLVVLHAVLRAAEVTHTQGGAIAVGDDDVAEIPGIGARGRRLHRVRARRAVEGAGRQVGVGGLHRADHVGKGQAALLQASRVEIQAEGIFLAAEHQHLRDPRQAGEALHHARVGDGVELGERQAFRGQR